MKLLHSATREELNQCDETMCSFTCKAILQPLNFTCSIVVYTVLENFKLAATQTIEPLVPAGAVGQFHQSFN